MEDPFANDSPIVIYRFCRVVIGVNCSPLLLNGILLADELADPEFVAKMLRSLYVDDLVSGGKNREEVKKLYTHASERLEEGGLG